MNKKSKWFIVWSINWIEPIFIFSVHFVDNLIHERDLLYWRVLLGGANYSNQSRLGHSLCSQNYLHSPSVWAQFYSIECVVCLSFFEIWFVSNGVWCEGLIQMFTKWNKYKKTREMINRMHQSFVCVYLPRFWLSCDAFREKWESCKNRCFIGRMAFCQMKNRRLRFNHNLSFTMQTKFRLLNIFSLDQYIQCKYVITY